MKNRMNRKFNNNKNVATEGSYSISDIRAFSTCCPCCIPSTGGCFSCT